jgi:hypothetical protein
MAMTDEELLTEYLRTKDDGLLTKLYEQMYDGQIGRASCRERV